jgi:hypothetical protein
MVATSRRRSRANTAASRISVAKPAREHRAVSRHAGLIALVSYGMSAGFVSVGLMELVGEAASQLTGRRVALGVALQILTALIVVAIASYFADVAIARCKRTLTELLRRFR